MNIIFKIDNQTEFYIRWEEYIRNNVSSYKYLPIYLEYMLFYSQNLLVDKSFVIIENNKCVGICFLPIENFNNKNFISFAEGYTISPLSIEKRIEKRIYELIEQIVKEFNVLKVKFYIDPLILEYTNKFNYLLEYGYIDSSSSDCLLNLRISQKLLWENLRKSYKALINSILKNDNYEVVIINKDNKSYEVHEEYRELHRKCAGRVTRTKETFDKQYELLENDFASLIGLKYKGIYIGFNYFFHFQKTVVYASGADDPEYENSHIPIYHVILWIATLYYKENGFDFIQYSQPCGYNLVNGFDDYLDKKQVNISHFKRGMGTTMVPLFRGIKYYNNSLLIEDIEKFKNQVKIIDV
ncbi:hypothetical protein PT502_08635 [Aliarcobacter butzleri]|uniref:hypothetical protein n=1 Tax=Aliarcobacter butzleri TaxID=28197 RepID=UPI0024DE5543|nr:hypothetical protein [Aliarcobacter butzleri]MDK2083867.1 hypothetical protein [Aliarcobacter butzleri]